jgi:membrane protein YdbS with pleckstrin-like domain
LEFQRLIFSFFFLVLLLSSFNKKKDLHLGLTMFFFKHGILATNIIVIPYNRVQHVALHEGFISGILDWQNRSFTAGGSASDIEIGIKKSKLKTSNSC